MMTPRSSSRDRRKAVRLKHRGNYTRPPQGCIDTGKTQKEKQGLSPPQGCINTGKTQKEKQRLSGKSKGLMGLGLGLRLGSGAGRLSLHALLVGLALRMVEGNTCTGCGDRSSCTASSGGFGGFNSSGMGRNLVLQRLFEGYDSLVRPGADRREPTEVTVDIFINSVDSISVDTMGQARLEFVRAVDQFLKYPLHSPNRQEGQEGEHRPQSLYSQLYAPRTQRVAVAHSEDYSLNIYMRQTWVDDRLSYNETEFNLSRITLDHKLYSEIWVPDLFFSNEKRSNIHCVTVPNSMIRIYPNGTVLYSSRYTLGLVCYMNLRYFPMDKQKCYMKIESYSHTMDEMLLRWRDSDTVQPVQRSDDLELPQFNLIDIQTQKCNFSYITGSYACLKVTTFLERQYGYYMIQTYIPSVLIVSLSWVSFWINIDAVPARISLGVLTVLTLTTQSVGVWMSLPRVSYIKAIDIWMSTCVVLVFAAMLEFAIVNTLARKEIRQMSIKARGTMPDGNVPADVVKRMMEEYQYGSPHIFDPGSRLLARRLDKLSRKTFPTFFAAFNIVYWCFFLISE